MKSSSANCVYVCVPYPLSGFTNERHKQLPPVGIRIRIIVIIILDNNQNHRNEFEYRMAA